MEKVLLKFSSAVYLTAFRRYAKSKNWEINLTELTIRCECSTKDLQAACDDFNAIVLESNHAAASQQTETEISFFPNPQLIHSY